MRDLTNLAWPEAPFGAEQRPFGRPAQMLAAFAFAWADRPSMAPVQVGAATVYLRVRRHGTAWDVDAGTLAIGFRVTVIDDAAEVPGLLAVVDRALTRARRHAAIVAGDHLGDDLDAVAGLSAAPLRGVAGVRSAWADRETRERGVAVMVDTAAEARECSAVLDLTSAPVTGAAGGGKALARDLLGRCLAIGLTAAVHAGRYRWEGTFRVGDAIDRAGWDVLNDEPATTASPAKRAAP